MNYLLDTNILLTYARGKKQADSLEQELELLSGKHTVVISVVAEAEIKSIGFQNNWGDKKLRKLDAILSRLLITGIKVDSIIEKYIEIDAYSQGKHPDLSSNFTARNMGKNDLWIAATAATLDLTLITADDDFDHLNGTFFEVRKINLKQYI